MSKSIAMSVFSLCFPWSRESPQCTVYLSYYWTACSLGLADGSHNFFCVARADKIMQRTFSGHFASSAAHLIAREEQTHCTFRSFYTMLSFYLEWRINHRRKVQLILQNDLRFPSQLSLFLLPCSFILQRQNTWLSSFWIGNILELRGLTCIAWGGTYGTLGEEYIKSPTGKYLIAGTINTVMKPGVIHEGFKLPNYRFSKHLKRYLPLHPHPPSISYASDSILYKCIK